MALYNIGGAYVDFEECWLVILQGFRRGC